MEKKLRRLVIIVSSASEMRLHWIRRTDVKLLNDANFFSKKYLENFFWNTIKHYEM